MRWNSNLVMLRRIGQEPVWKAVGEILSCARSSGSGAKSVPRFTISRQQILDLVSIFALFEEATCSLQGDGITISSVIPALLGIDDILSQLKTQFPALQQHLRGVLHERFHNIIHKEEYILATVLDNRYKLFPFADFVDLDGCEVASTSADSPVAIRNCSTLKPPTKGEAKRTLSLAMEKARITIVSRYAPVSYTHLTLPTIYSV